MPLYILGKPPSSANGSEFFCPLSIVIGPEGSSDAYPFHPPNRAIIHAAQLSVFIEQGFFCFSVFPSNLDCIATTDNYPNFNFTWFSTLTIVIFTVSSIFYDAISSYLSVAQTIIY